MGKTSVERKNAWNQENYDRITIMIKKGEKERLKEAATDSGFSVSRYVIEAINSYAGKPMLSVLDDTSKQKKDRTSFSLDE